MLKNAIDQKNLFVNVNLNDSDSPETKIKDYFLNDISINEKSKFKIKYKLHEPGT